jgi:hypothetical protein
VSVTTTVLFNSPQREIASLLQARLGSAAVIQIVSGFVTVEGMDALKPVLLANPGALGTFVVGAGTYRAFDAFDALVKAGVRQANLYVHLGHDRLPRGGTSNTFQRYHPMLHSKVYYGEVGDGTAWAVIGSHNVTSFALTGLNGEAAVLLEGAYSEPQFEAIRNHIATARRQAIAYDPGMKAAYAWWTNQFMLAPASEAGDVSPDAVSTRTLLILAQSENGNVPLADEIVYFELPPAVKIASMGTNIHLFLFRNLPPSPQDALANLDAALRSYQCEVWGLEMQGGGVELIADWWIDNPPAPILRRGKYSVRPTPRPDMQQVRVRVADRVDRNFEYLFDAGSRGWRPIVDDRQPLRVSGEEPARVQMQGQPSYEYAEWYRVKALTPYDGARRDLSALTLEGMFPEVGPFILLSLRRRERREP